MWKSILYNTALLLWSLSNAKC